MICNWCGEETPDESQFCEQCGAKLEIIPDFDVPSIEAPSEEAPLTDPASRPEQPDLGRKPIAVIAVISALFGIAVALLLVVVVIRLLGL